MTSKNNHQRGGVFVELILALPVIIIIPFAVLELSRLLEKVQIVNVIGQELAATVYRECADFSDFRLTTNKLAYTKDVSRIESQTATCLTDAMTAINGVNGVDSAVNGSFNISVSVYRYYPVTDADAAAGTSKLYRTGVFGNPSVECDGAPSGGATGLCTASDPKIREGSTVYISKAGIEARERFVIVEIGYTYTAIAPFVRILREIGGTQHGYREVTIL